MENHMSTFMGAVNRYFDKFGDKTRNHQDQSDYRRPPDEGEVATNDPTEIGSAKCPVSKGIETRP